jgi:hypothetical protein
MREMQDPDPRRYRQAEVALELGDLDDRTYRAFLSRGRIAGRIRRLLGGGEWDFRRPLLEWEEADRLRDDLTQIGVDARWEGLVLVISDPRGRWHPARIGPTGDGLYDVGRVGRAVRPSSGFEREWQEVVPLPGDRPLTAAGIAAALDTGLPLGPAFDRIEEEVEIPVLVEALPLSRTDHARERISVLLAHHRSVAQAVVALPALTSLLPPATRISDAAQRTRSPRSRTGRAGPRRCPPTRT